MRPWNPTANLTYRQETRCVAESSTTETQSDRIYSWVDQRNKDDGFDGAARKSHSRHAGQGALVGDALSKATDHQHYHL